ncbi:MAG TPA: GFA family protein [Allosphingosinicella sp.]
MAGSRVYSGGCRCGQLRYEATGEPLFAGYCFCTDCRKSSGSGFIPFMGFSGADLSFSGTSREVRCTALRGSEAVRNFCTECGGLVFGGRVGLDEQHTIYAGSLDDPSLFEPSVAIFAREKPDWVSLPPEVRCFALMPE